jgi:hypothetical protein
MLNRNRENMPATYHFGLKILFDGYLTNSQFLCDGYVIGNIKQRCKVMIINHFLSDGNVIGRPYIFEGHLIKEK